jgi:hypothetical protein
MSVRRGLDALPAATSEGSMTARGPSRDSVLEALQGAFGVLARPGFLWAPVLLTAITAIPLVALTAVSGTPDAFTSQAELEAFLRAFAPTLAATILLGLALGPIASAVTYRLAAQYLDGAAPTPVAPGLIGLAWRFLLQGLAFGALGLVGVILVGLLFIESQAVAGLVLASLITTIVTIVLFVAVGLRLAVAPALLVAGAGPIESMNRSWELTRGRGGRVFRWFFATGLILGIAVSILGAVVDVAFKALGQPALGQLLGAALAAPFSIVSAIVLVTLARHLGDPGGLTAPPEPAPWMSPDDAPVASAAAEGR